MSSPIESSVQWRLVTLNDRHALHRAVGPYAPYSDFNFASLYAWNTDGTAACAFVHGNLIVRIADYRSGEPVYSVLGVENVCAAVAAVVREGERTGESRRFSLVPEETARELSKAGLAVESDADNDDYVFSAPRLATYQGNRLGSKRNLVNRFHQSHPRAVTAVLDTGDPGMRREMEGLFETWRVEKGQELSETEHERAALTRLLDAAPHLREVFTLGVQVDGALVAFCVAETLGNGYALIHFQKTRVDGYVGLNAYLLREVARHVLARGCTLINYEQDLGIEGLRKAKRSFDPAFMLHKYTLADAATGIAA